MAEAQAFEQDPSDLPPPGSRWGAGARSVLPYLTKSLQARPAPNADPRDTAAPREADARSEALSRHPSA